LTADPQARRLERFFQIDIPVNYLIAAVMFTLWHFFRHWSLLTIALLVLGNTAQLFWSRAQLRNGRTEVAAIGIASGILVMVLTGTYLSGSVVMPIMAVLTLWPLIVALPYLGQKWLLRLMFVTTGSAVFVSVLSLFGDLVGISASVPSWVWITIDAATLPMFVGFMCLFVWHYSSHLQDTLSQLRSANAALKESERELERKVAERTEELARKNQELMQLDEMKTKFVSNASHELRSPLSSIRAFSEMLADDPTLNERQAEFARIINAESERLSRLAGDLLDLSRMEAGIVRWQPRRVDLRAELEEMIDSQRLVAELKGIALELHAPAHLPPVTADPDGLRRVLLNLLDNALKFTTQGHVALSAEPNGQCVRVSVSDTGPGISPADQALVFERFYQAGNVLTEKPSGAGLGLAICREILAQHGSELRLDSTVGQGSCFSFELPVAA
jgi:signal transduction histidine kinase